MIPNLLIGFVIYAVPMLYFAIPVFQIIFIKHMDLRRYIKMLTIILIAHCLIATIMEYYSIKENLIRDKDLPILYIALTLNIIAVYLKRIYMKKVEASS